MAEEHRSGFPIDKVPGLKAAPLRAAFFLGMCGHMWSLSAEQAIFIVERPKTDIFAPSGGWEKELPSISPWTVATVVAEPVYRSDENLKKKYGVELAKAANSFEAACVILEDTSQALWVSFNWVTDPIVLASRDVYLKTVAQSSPPLDKEQLAAKVLALAEEKILKNGILSPTIDAKDRIAAFKLYSEIMGYTGKIDIDASTKNFTHNEMIVKFVKPEVKDATPIKVPNIKSEILNEEPPLINLKLVSGSK